MRQIYQRNGKQQLATAFPPSAIDSRSLVQLSRFRT